MSQLADSAVGAILEIPPKALEDIDKAERAIKRLGMTSAEWAGKVRDHWEVVASHGLDQFIKKISEAQEALKGLGSSTSDVKLNTETATQQMSNFTEKVQSESSKVSASLQEIAQTPIDAKGVKEYAEAWNLTFKDVQDKIKALRNGLQVQNVGSEGGQVQLQAIKAWEDYYRSINKVNEESNKHARTVNELRGKISETQQAIDHENEAIARFTQKVRDAETAVNAFKTANPNFNIDKAEQQMESLRGKIQRLYEQLEGGGLSDKKENRITREIEQMKAQFATLDNTVTTARRVYRELAEAEDNYERRANQANTVFDQKNTALRSLYSSLQKAQSAQSSFNAELEKGNTAKSLASEYAKLTKRLQEVNDAMTKFQSAGGNVNSASYKALENEWMQIMARRKEIEKSDIAEVNQYRQRMAQSAYQADLSAFIQNEAQKTAEAKRQADERARYQQEQSAKYFASYKGALNYANAVMGDKVNRGIATNTYENRERVIKNLESAIKSLNKADSDYEQKLKNLKTALNDLKNAQNEVKDAMKAPAKTTTIADANQARKIAEQTKTLKDYETAYKMLIEVMKQTPQGRSWNIMNEEAKKLKANIDEIKKKMGELNNQTSRTSNIMGQLQGRIAAAFSIGAITGFIKKMVEVRAQFELQRVALGAILQDTDKANHIFTEVQQMALQSPFSIMQLERATKQIAAFGFEADKLKPTLKMLADMSAGLGVEIDRLVLVMGHLKARNFLEGTMVRQFTNAGFNVLGELSKYYTEIEGKLISVAEVQDRVKKKMVSFEDVEEVLKRVTSAGGMFYDMQAKQADSLWGQMQRIKDAYDLMLNEIGKDNQSMIARALTLIRSLINHWEMMAPIIKDIGYVMAGVFAVKGIKMMLVGLTTLGTMLQRIPVYLRAIRMGIHGMNLAWSTTGVGLLITAVLTAVEVFRGLNAEAERLDKEIGRIQDEGESNMYKLIYRYQELADVVSSTTSSYEEKNEALEELKRTYKDILPSEMLEIENIQKMRDGYKEATDAIREYSNEQMRKNAEEEVEKSQKQDFTDWQNDLANGYAKMLIKKNNLDTTEAELKGTIKRITDSIYEEIKDGTTKSENAFMRFVELFGKYYNLASVNINKGFKDQFNHTTKWLAEFSDGLNDIIDTYDKKREEVEARFSQALSFEQLQQFNQTKPQRKQYEELTKAVDAYAKALKAVKSEGGVELFNKAQSELTEEQKSAVLALTNSKIALNEIRQEMGLSVLTMDDVTNSLGSNMEVQKHLRDTSQETFGKMLDLIEQIARASGNNMMLAWVEKMRRELDGLKLTPAQQAIQDIIDDVESLNNVNLGDFKWAIIDSTTTIGTARKAVKNELDTLKENIASYQSALAKGVMPIIAQLLFLDGRTLEESNKMLESLDLLWGKLGGHEKSKKSTKSSDAELKRWQDLKKAIESVQTAYEKARKSFTVDESNKMIEERWGGVFKALGADIKDFYKNGVYDMEALTKAYQVLIDKVQKAATTEDRKKFLSELIASQKDTEIEIKVKLQEDSEKNLKADLDEMFANYELTEELKKLGVSVDLTYMVGGKPTTLEGIRKEIARLKKESGGDESAENLIKIYEDYEKKLIQVEEKNQKARLKNYIKYLVESMGERAQIEIKALQDINKIREDAELDAFSKEQAIMQRRKKMQEDLSKFDFDQLKGSDVYLSVFKDLETASKEQLQYVLDKLKELQSTFKNLSPSQVKAIASEMKKIEDALADKDSMKNLGINLRDSIKYARKRNALLKEQTKIQDSVNANDKMLAAAQEWLYELEMRRNSIEDKNSEEYRESNDAVERQQRLIKELQDKIKQLQEELKKVTGEIDAGESALKGWQKGMANVHSKISEVKDSLDSVFDGLDSMGLINDAFRDTWESISEIIGGLDTFMGALESMDITRPFTIITGSIKAIGGMFQSIGGIFGIGDKKRERNIKRLTEKVEELDKAYQKLEKSIEDAYAVDDYKAGYTQAQENLEKQRQAYQEMLELEKSKKKTDNEKVKEYEDALEDIAEKEKELRNKMIEDMGSTIDFKSSAEDFVSAWLDAFKETGDGLDALNDKWDEFIESMFIKQAALAKAGSIYEKVIGIINNAFDKKLTGFELEQAIDEAQLAAEEGNEQLNEYLKLLAEVFHISPSGKGELILSDLQKGIQNITEPQAAAIEAYLNSMRFAVFRHTEQLDTLIATIQMQYGSGAENPVVTELKGIRSVLDSIDTKFDSIIGKNGNNKAIRIAT